MLPVHARLEKRVIASFAYYYSSILPHIRGAANTMMLVIGRGYMLIVLIPLGVVILDWWLVLVTIVVLHSDWVS